MTVEQKHYKRERIKKRNEQTSRTPHSPVVVRRLRIDFRRIFSGYEIPCTLITHFYVDLIFYK